MAGVDKALEAVGAAVGIGYGIEIDAVVAPSAVARVGRDWHDLNVGDAEFEEVVEAGDGAVERAFRGECPDVQLVEDGACEWRGLPASIVPGEGGVIVDSRQAVDSARLPKAARIGVGSWVVVEEKSVV
jgi:hypothetical protein